MLTFPLRAATMIALVFAVCSTICQASTSDALTGLPLYPGSPFTMDLPAASYCGIPLKQTMYQPDGKVATIDRWFAAHLPGFQLHRGFTDRTQDMFIKPDGTVMVAVTGVPGSSGNVFAVSYTRYSRPLAPAAMATLNQKVVKCR